MAAFGGNLLNEKVSRLLSGANGKPVLKPNRPLVLKDTVANRKPRKGGHPQKTHVHSLMSHRKGDLHSIRKVVMPDRYTSRYLSGRTRNTSLDHILLVHDKRCIDHDLLPFTEATCITEMSLLMVCWKQNNFVDGLCSNEINSFYTCVNQATAQRKADKINMHGGRLSPKQATTLLKRYPNQLKEA